MSEFLGVFRGGSSGGVARSLVVTSGELFLETLTCILLLPAGTVDSGGWRSLIDGLL